MTTEALTTPLEFRTHARSLYTGEDTSVIAFALRDMEKRFLPPHDELDHRVKDDSSYSFEEVSKMIDILSEIILIKDNPTTVSVSDESLNSIYSNDIGPLLEKKLSVQAWAEMHKDNTKVKTIPIGTNRDPLLILFLMRILEKKIGIKE